VIPQPPQFAASAGTHTPSQMSRLGQLQLLLPL
jgi:hypothetical protein